MAKKTTAGKEVVKAPTTNVTQFNFGADVGAGMEGSDRDSFAIPFLRVLQQLSPQVNEADSAYVKGAKAGMFINSVTNRLYAEVIFLPCVFQRRLLQWAPRGTDGGFRGEYVPEQVDAMLADGRVVEVDGKLYVPSDDGKVNEKKCDKISDTRSHFGVIVDDVTGEYERVLMALSSTQIKKSKQLMSMLSSVKVKTSNGSVTPPTWINRIKITSIPESNDNGSWHGVKFEADGFITSQELYDEGKAFHDSIVKGEVKANYHSAEDVDSAAKGF